MAKGTLLMSDSLMPPVIVEIMASIKDFSAKKDETIAGMKEIQAAGDTTGAKLGALGTKIGNFALVGAVGVAAYATKLAMSYQEALDTVARTTNLTKQQIDELSPTILKVSKNTATAATDIAAAYAQAVKGGLSLKDANAAVTASAQFAKAENGSLTDTLNAALVVQRLHIQGTKSVAQTMDIFTNAVKDSKLTANDLNAAMSGKALSVFGAYGMNIQEITTLFAGLANQNIYGTQAMRTMNTALAALEKSMTTATGKATPLNLALKGIGINQATLASEVNKPGGFLMILQQINDGFNKYATAGQKALGITAFLNTAFGKTVGPTLANFMPQLPMMLQMYADANKPGSTLAQFNEWLKSPSGSWQNFLTSLQDALIPLGNKILPALTTALQAITKIMNAPAGSTTNKLLNIGAMIVGALTAGFAASKMANIGITIAEAFGATIVGGTATVIGAAVAAGVLGALAIWKLGAPTQATADAARQAWDENKFKGIVDVAAMTVNTFTGWFSKITHIPIPNIPIIHAAATANSTAVPGGNSSVMPGTTPGTVKIKVHP